MLLTTSWRDDSKKISWANVGELFPIPKLMTFLLSVEKRGAVFRLRRIIRNSGVNTEQGYREY
jgi:hypothetical protein